MILAMLIKRKDISQWWVRDYNVPIQECIEFLIKAQQDGATHFLFEILDLSINTFVAEIASEKEIQAQKQRNAQKVKDGLRKIAESGIEDELPF